MKPLTTLPATATVEPKSAVAELARRNARRHLIPFITLTKPDYLASWHHLLLADALEKVAHGLIKRLMVFMPPRHGKSEQVSVRFPAWYLGNFPKRSVICASYAAELASDFGRRVRNLATSPLFSSIFPECKISDDAQAATRFVTQDDGQYIAVGIGGPMTGRGADLLDIDDPMKNAEEAYSKTVRDAHWAWYQSVAYPRLTKDGAIVLTMTRWHVDDLAGRLLREQQHGGERWTVLNLAALAEADGPYRKLGTALWPEQFSVTRLEQIKTAIGSRAWNALYQQRPTLEDGGCFKRSWWRSYTPSTMERPDQVIQSWDMAFKATDDSSYVVGQVWGKRGVQYFLLDQVRDRMDFVTTIEAMQRLSAKWPRAVCKLVEDKANGPAVLSALSGKLDGLIAYTPEGSKEARAAAVSPLVEAGQVYLPDVAAWVQDFVEECAGFPAWPTDDQVDAMSQALTWWGLPRLSQDMTAAVGDLESAQAVVW